MSLFLFFLLAVGEPPDEHHYRSLQRQVGPPPDCYHLQTMEPQLLAGHSRTSKS